MLLNGPLINDRLGLQLRGSYFDPSTFRTHCGMVEPGRDPRPSKAENYDVGGKLHFKLDDQNSFWVDGFSLNTKLMKTVDQRLGNFITRGDFKLDIKMN